MHASRLVLVALLVVSGCSRVTAAYPSNGICTPKACGDTVAVETTLTFGTKLTRAECEEVCAGVWCGQESLVTPSPGCNLTPKSQVYCDPIADDCGHCFFPCTTARECADGGGTCTNGCCAN